MRRPVYVNMMWTGFDAADRCMMMLYNADGEATQYGGGRGGGCGGSGDGDDECDRGDDGVECGDDRDDAC